MYRRYPYTNFHDLNLDYILKEVQSLKEEVSKVINIREEIEETFNNIQADIDNLQAVYDQMLLDNQAFKNEVREDFQLLEVNIQSNLRDLENELRADYANFNIEMSEKFNNLNQLVNRELVSFNNQLTAMNRRLDEALANLWMNITMVNPFTGVEESVLSVIDYLASLHMRDGITAGDYDGLELTAQVYDNKQLTAREYDTQADILLRQ